MNATAICPQCDSPLRSDVAGGLCPKCLGKLAFEPALESEAARNPQRRLGDYELIREIARGGMGVVYLARQTSLNRLVALKVVLHGPFSSPEFVQRFRTETAAIAALQHPNIVAIYEVGEQDGEHFFSMQYIEGDNLAELVRAQPLPARRAAQYLQRIAAAVDYAHQRGVLHRDLKPSNVLLDQFDEPRITDFGLAKVLGTDAELTTTGQVLGSPNYIAPEQAVGKQTAVGTAADVYSLGAILYHLLTGRPPFQGETLSEILIQVQHTEPVAPRRLNPSVPVDLQTICLKCLQKEPARRYASARELTEDLARFLANEPIHARAVTPAEKLWLWGKRRPVLAALIVALHVVLALGIGGIVWQWRRAETSARGEREQRRAAEEFAARGRLNLYAGDISFAARALERGDLGLARRTLAALQPRPGESDLRGFEWRYLWSQCQGDQLATLGAHDWIVTSVTFTPDGKLLATGSQDGTVKIWDVTERKLLTTLNTATGAVWSVAFTPDAQFLVSAGVGGTKFWENGRWQNAGEFPGRAASVAHTAPLLAIAENTLFYWWEPAGEVSLWNFATREKLWTAPKPARAAALSPDGNTLAIGDREPGVELWDITARQLRRTLPTTHATWALVFSPDSTQLLALAGAEPPTLWDLTSTNAPRELTHHTMSTWAGAFSPDGKTLATTSSDQSVQLVDVATLKPSAVLRGHEHEVWCVAFSPDGQLLATGGKDRKVLLWSGESRQRRETISNRGSFRPFFSPNGASVVTAGVPFTNAATQVWDSSVGTLQHAIGGRRMMGFSPDGTALVRWAVGGRALEFISLATTNSVTVPLGGLDERSRGLQYQGFTSDWKKFYAVDELGRVAVWEATSGKLVHGVTGPTPPISAGAISPNGNLLALAARREPVVRLYHFATGKALSLAGHHDTIRGLAFSPDGKLLASGSMDGTIRLWNTATGESLAELPGHMEETSDVAFSPDGETLASVNVKLSVKLWHVATRRQLVAWEFPDAGDSVRFSPDGRFLAVTTQTNSVVFLEAPPAP